MSQIAVRTATAFVLVVLTAFVGVVDANTDDARVVVVRVYDTGNVAADVRAAAIRTAASIVKQSGGFVDWRDCTDHSATLPCQSTNRTRDLIVRIMPTFVGGKTLRKDAVEALKSLGDSEPPLGFAVIDPDSHVGTMATIFQDQVRTVARRTGVECSELLGRALAHEIGHLLLRVPGHSRTGLMRALWTDAELTTNRLEDWQFAPHDRNRLQLNLIGP